MLKRVVAFYIALSLVLSFSAAGFAEQEAGQRWAKGTVRSAESFDVYAPVGGQLRAFDIEIGDEFSAEDLMLSIRTTEALAPENGVVRLLRARVGDQAPDVILQYGALLYIEREGVYRIDASTSTAYDKADNRSIVLGETVRVYNGKESDPLEATGTVISVSGKDYVVEIESDVFDLEAEVKIYRGTGDTYKNADRIGKGKVERAPMVPVKSDGVVAGVLVEEGEAVKRGDKLLTMDSASSKHEETADPEIIAPQDGMLTALYGRPGEYVEQNQRLATLDSLTRLELVVEVDELDLASVFVGQTMRVKLDAFPGEELSGIVENISSRPITVLDTTKYEVTLSFSDKGMSLRPGMHVTVYW